MKKNQEIERDLGEQPIAHLMREHDISAQLLVVSSPEPITHKMVARACKGRRLTPKARNKMIKAMSVVLGRDLKKTDLFSY